MPGSNSAKPNVLLLIFARAPEGALRLAREPAHEERLARRPHDASVEKALRLMREALDRRWTVSDLARQVGMSRPVFARKFRDATGYSPLRYLTRYRMERAAELLEQSDLPLAAVAQWVGYESEFAFNRAFKRHHALAPGSYRRQSTRRGFTPHLRAAA